MPGPGYFAEGQPATLHLGASRLKESTQLELDLQVACAKRHRSTAQGTGHHGRTETSLDQEDEEGGAQHEDEQDDVTVERLMKNNIMMMKKKTKTPPMRFSS